MVNEQMLTEREILKELFMPAIVNVELMSGKGNLLGVASIKTLNGLLEINGWRISKSKFDGTLWIQPPCFKENKEDGKYHKAFWINDKEIEGLIKTRVKTEYEQELMIKEYEDEGF